MDIEDFDDIRPANISAVIVLNITLSVIVVAVFVKYPILLEDRTNLFMLSLTLSDLANGCTSMLISAALCSRATPNARRMDQYLPKIQALCSVWFNFNSMHSLCWVTVCKMVAITKPLRYEQLLTRSRCSVIISGIWISGVGTTLLLSPFVSTDFNFETCMYMNKSDKPTVNVVLILFGLVFGLVLPLVIIVISTGTIFRVIVQTHRQIAVQTNSIAGHISVENIVLVLFGLVFGLVLLLVVIVISTGTIFRVIVQTHRQIATQTNSIAGHISVENMPSLTVKSIRSGRNVLIVCLAYILLTIPISVEVMFVIVGMENYVSPFVNFAAVWTLFCNSFVNSLLYLLLFRNIRSKALSMLNECSNLYRSS